MTAATAVRPADTALDIEARLALADAGMTLRLEQAAVAFEVNTAHIPNEPVVELPFVELVPSVAPVATPAPYLAPLAACLHRAHAILTDRGWCTGGLRDEQEAVCLAGAIRAAATSRGQADEACALLLDAIQAEFTGAATVPSWNDQQRDQRVVMRLLGQAADRADAQGV